jgi:hypothetical protein
MFEPYKFKLSYDLKMKVILMYGVNIQGVHIIEIYSGKTWAIKNMTGY